MKKRKTYEISVIDKTYSKTISDETKFYTSDTALELVFKLKETDYTFESAEIVLFNIDDRSLTTRPVSKVNNDFVYELDDDIIPHYGEWHGQLRFEAGEIYVSSPVKFRIENDLGNERPPQLSDVQSWVSLKRYADKLTEELKQAVLSIEGVEDTFNANETVRQNQFETAEQSRQTTFETNESEREETFSTNENTRQTQELEREKAEATRQTTFTTNEVYRTDTFNANEATREENETARQQAESQRQSTFEANETERQSQFENAEQERQSAELTRVDNENQRKIDHANRSAELAGKADKVVISNEISDNDRLMGIYGQYSFSNEEIVYITSELVTSSRIEYPLDNSIPDDIYYASFEIKPKFPNDTYVRIGASNGEKYNPTAGEWSSISSSIRANNNERARFYHLTNSNYVKGEEIRFRNITVINLTKTFGSGNEPTKEEMDSLIEITGYIDVEYALNNKEMLVWTLALIRRNKNAIIALGGA